MTRPIGPGGGIGAGNGGGPEAAWIIPGLGGLLLIGSAACWLGGTLAAGHTGAGTPRAPFNLTLESVNRSDEAAADYLQLSEVFDPGQDVLTYVWLNGHQRFRSAMLTMPHFTVAMLRDDQHLHTGRDLRWISPRDSRLEVPPGGSAVFVLESPPPEVVELVERGKAEAVRLESGRTVWVVQPEDGVTLFGVRVVEGDPFDAPGSASAG